jgi:uncharacterized phiE125 gp8 family phage protein
MSVVVVTPPSPAIDLDTVKAHLRVDFSDDDTLIQAYVDAAVSHIDGPRGSLGRAIWTQTLELRQNVFGTEVRLPYGPVQSVTSIKYVDSDGAEQTLAEGQYILTNDGVVALAHNASWPTLRGDAEGVRVRYVAGFPTVPQSVISAVLMMVAHWYSNRDAVVIGQTAQEMPMGAQALLAQFRSWMV